MLVRISVGNLVQKIISPAKVNRSNQGSLIGILSSGAYKKGHKRFQPIGGAAEMTKRGIKFLEKNFGAKDFYRSQEGNIDARFFADDEHLEKIFNFFSKRNPDYFETDPRREIIEELSQVELVGDILPEMPAVLTSREAESIIVTFVDTIVQPFSDEVGTSTLAKKGIPSRRLFHRFDIWVLPDIFRKIEESKVIRLLTEEEISTTEGGCHKGNTQDGVELADNFV